VRARRVPDLLPLPCRAELLRWRPSSVWAILLRLVAMAFCRVLPQHCAVAYSRHRYLAICVVAAITVAVTVTFGGFSVAQPPARFRRLGHTRRVMTQGGRPARYVPDRTRTGGNSRSGKLGCWEPTWEPSGTTGRVAEATFGLCWRF
jgi:hypothetical protein